MGEENSLHSSELIISFWLNAVAQAYSITLSSTSITQQPSKLVINSKHYPPALVDEHYPVSVTLTNEESASVEAIIRVEIKAIESQGKAAGHSSK